MKPVRVLLSLLLAATGLTLVALGPAGPAQAKCTSLPDCIDRYYYEIRIWQPDPPCYCPELVVEYRDDWVQVVGVDFRSDRDLSVDLQQNYLGLTAQGLSYFDQAQAAARNQDRALAARLHAQGAAAFQAAGRLLEGTSLKLAAVGDVDLEKHTFGPRAIDWLAGAGEHLARGLSLVSAAGGQLSREAAGELDLASQLLVQGGAQ